MSVNSSNGTPDSKSTCDSESPPIINYAMNDLDTDLEHQQVKEYVRPCPLPIYNPPTSTNQASLTVENISLHVQNLISLKQLHGGEIPMCTSLSETSKEIPSSPLSSLDVTNYDKDIPTVVKVDNNNSTPTQKSAQTLCEDYIGVKVNSSSGILITNLPGQSNSLVPLGQSLNCDQSRVMLSPSKLSTSVPNTLPSTRIGLRTKHFSRSPVRVNKKKCLVMILHILLTFGPVALYRFVAVLFDINISVLVTHVLELLCCVCYVLMPYVYVNNNKGIMRRLHVPRFN
jgi:hypothetical protein